MATFYEIYQNYLQNPYGGDQALWFTDRLLDGYAKWKIGYAEVV
jgi:hypothetical protein